MVTKEQALAGASFIQISAYTGEVSHHNGTAGLLRPTVQLARPMAWRANGKCKTWKRTPDKFQLPIKHGLYSYGYITEENAHLFEAVT